MRYTAMIIGFVLATVTAVGAAEPDRPNSAEFRLNDLVKTKAIYGAVFGCARTDTVPPGVSVADRTIGDRRET